MATVANDIDRFLAANPAPAEPAPADRDLLIYCSTPGGFKVSTTGTITPASMTFDALALSMPGAVVNFSATGGTITTSGNRATLTSANATSDAITVTATTTYEGVTYTRSATIQKVYDGAKGDAGNNGTSPNKNGIAFLYKWASSLPSKPAGTSTFTWAGAANTAYGGADGWSITPPTNPGTPLLMLFVASIAVTDVAAAATTTVGYASSTVAAWAQNGSNGSNGSNGANGATGVQSGDALVYQWAATIPAGPVGSPTFVWATGLFGAAPANWSLTPGASPSLGMSLWQARVNIVDSAANAQTSFNWSTASILAVGYAGTNGTNGTNGSNGTNGLAGAEGVSYVTAYCASATANTTTAPGNTIGRNSVPSANSGGLSGTYGKAVPVLSAGQFMYQTDGLYNPANDTVVWSVPYWSSLKVGTLSAIAANLGAITGGSIDIGTGATSWHVDALGNMWIGAAAFGSAPFRVSNTGAMTALSGTFGGALTGQIVKASNMVVTGAGGTLNRDPYFTDPASWALGNFGAATGPGGAAPANTYVQGTVDYASVTSERFPIDSNKSYSTSVSVWASAGNNRAFRVIITFFDGNGAAIVSNVSGNWSDGLGSHFTQIFLPGGDGAWRTYKDGSFGARVAGRPIPAAAKSCSVTAQINAGGSGTSNAMAVTGLRVDEMVDDALVVKGGLSADRISAVTLAAIVAYLGNVELGAGGAIRQGQSGYDTGIGAFLGDAGSGNPAFSMRAPSGKYVRMNPATDVFDFNGVNLNAPVLDNFSVSASGSAGGSYPNGSSTYGTFTVSASGGRWPYQYIWSIATRYKSSATSRININGGAVESATISGTGSNCETNATLTCVVIDANQRARVLTFEIFAQHGTPP